MDKANLVKHSQGRIEGHKVKSTKSSRTLSLSLIPHFVGCKKRQLLQGCVAFDPNNIILHGFELFQGFKTHHTHTHTHALEAQQHTWRVGSSSLVVLLSSSWFWNEPSVIINSFHHLKRFSIVSSCWFWREPLVITNVCLCGFLNFLKIIKK